MIYIPDLENYQCHIVLNEEVIRSYKETPEIDKQVEYRDYFYNSNYYYNDGIETITNNVTCLDSNVLSNDIYYRNDIDKILVIFIIMAFVCFYCPLKLLFRFFKRSR